tara:strand:- start:428 stop:1213 length:786 start_codon:yes stop_codon:yes gene_type:complete
MNIKKREIKFDKTISNLFKSYKINNRDTIFLHIKLRNLKTKYNISYKKLSSIIVENFEKRGVKNILVPSFFYSFDKKRKFDVNKTVSENGFFSEFFRKRYAQYRSNDPFFSVCFYRKELIKSKEKKIDFNSSFKKKTIWNELFKNNVTIVNIGLDHLIITLIHYIEYDCKVPYRGFFKRKGYKKINKKLSPITYNLYGRKNLDDVGLDWPKIEKFLIKKKIIKKSGNSSINFKCFKIKDAAKVLKPQIKKNPYFLVKKLKF